ncbi:MAG: 5'/3'-nucleotidase SurE [Rhodopirellula sp. JB044]|uniref:5'/3'-nucleotidase SurE n=1 Tax=Rhodopirellula sp. JB044 TaxID=3342844 RepID=UPI00370B057D
MQILITNDDGIGAPGIDALHRAITDFLARREIRNIDLLVVAPDRGRSECGHSVTTSRDLLVRQERPGWISVDGTPVDCVRVALNCICPSAVAVFSGVNAGANVGQDLMVSGTFAAAREAALHSRPAMAISHYRRPEVPKTWDHVTDWLTPALEAFFSRELPQLRARETDKPKNAPHASMTYHRSEANQKRPVWNVNLPAILPKATTLPPTTECFVDETHLERRGPVIKPISSLDADNDILELPKESTVRLSSEFHDRPRMKGSDVEQCFSGKITISHVDPHVATRTP